MNADNSDKNLNMRVVTATKWSLLTELAAKVISPITQMALARLLAPEAFGVVATITMVTSFAEMIADSGFQKYIIQHKFESEQSMSSAATVAFWTNLALAILMWILIVLLRDPISSFVGSPGKGASLAVACASLPLASFISIQLGVLRRNLEFKRMMPARIVSSFVPLVVTVPLAACGFDYWSLIVGTLCGYLVNAVALTLLSPWKPRLYYSVGSLRQMLSFSAWSLLEAIAIWLTSWVGTLVVGNALSQYYLGLYKTPMTFVNSCFALVTNATTPILFSSLSKLQDDLNRFKQLFLRFQLLVSVVVLPLGVMLFSFRELFVYVLLGEQWSEAALMFGLWSLSTSLMIVFSYYCSEVFRAMGHPKTSLLAQIIYLIIYVPVLVASAAIGFFELVVATSAIRLASIAIDQFFMRRLVGIGFLDVLGNVRIPLLVSVICGVCSYWLAQVFAGEMVMLAVLAAAVTFLYFMMLYIPEQTRRPIKECLTMIQRKIGRSTEHSE